MNPDPSRLMQPVRAIAREAGLRILEVYQAEFAVETKADHTPLTAADRAAHSLIVRELGLLTPGMPVWSEEGAAVPLAQRSQWPWFWLVDPLDGTREFIGRNGEFTVNIALVRGQQPALGIIHVPVLDRDYWGGPDLGAWRGDGVGSPRSIRVRRPPAQPLRVAGSRSHGGDALARFLAALGPHELLSMGSSLKFCLVAEGNADLYPRLGPTSEWDTAAGQAIVEGAGGQVVDARGHPLRYNTREQVLNPDFLACGDTAASFASLLAHAAGRRDLD
ncbi:3'(2'), 5'-bisphosphate nucleotidase [Gammaproteobacteria bacterium]|nr:3'(2'),5'-bisphosphate nucleotidase CysQ [Gammaproteobacteria bacterium]QOJ33069.1 MAG: 3'(2'),5'-bisphosphate nucleotidase CysQ [Gammaproteobacteria bacterium]CAG0942837.1 3'(2'), 5'-bisphosphate nucleotidase [Gammaproteobacteria bacterium]